jgi:hypothetical protein
MTTGRINQVARDEASTHRRTLISEETRTHSERSPRPAFDTQPALRNHPSLDNSATQTERTRRRCSSDTNHHDASKASQHLVPGQKTPANHQTTHYIYIEYTQRTLQSDA